MTISSQRWDGAACRKVDPEIFFPDRGTSPVGVRVCMSCPLLAACTEYVLTTDPDPTMHHGVWAGMYPHERDQRRKGLDLSYTRV